MNRQKTLESIRRIILDDCFRLSPAHVIESASLTQDLNLSYAQLEVLFSRLREGVGANLLFTPWYIRALRPGQDTVGSLVDFLLDPKSAAWRTPSALRSAA